MVRTDHQTLTYDFKVQNDFKTMVQGLVDTFLNQPKAYKLNALN